jgi:hypothetical protein
MMRMMSVCVAVGAVAIGGLLATDASAQQGRREFDRRGGGDSWERLGCVEVRRRSDWDVIQVGRQEGRFKAIRLQIERRDIHINDLRVFYADGEPDRLAFNTDVRAGVPSRPLDLAGWARAIQRIEISARKAQGEARGPAEVCIFGLAASREEIDLYRGGGRPGPGAYIPGDLPRGLSRDWKELGCQKAGFINDRDTIPVGNREGRFRAVAVGATGNDVRISDIRVIYGNGESEHLPFNESIRRGEVSRPIDLAGDRRFIERVDLVYHSRPSFRGEGRVCVYGIE